MKWTLNSITFLCLIINLLLINIGIYLFFKTDYAIIPMIATSICFIIIFLPVIRFLPIKIKSITTLGMLSVIICGLIVLASIFTSSFFTLFSDIDFQIYEIIANFFHALGITTYVILVSDWKLLILVFLWGALNTFWFYWIEKVRQNKLKKHNL